MAKIILPSGATVYVDAEDKALIGGFSWHIGSGYAVAEIGSRKEGTRKVIRMHRLIMGEPNGIVDHINRNKLDNRRSNLRLSDRSKNGMNRPKPANNTSGYKGVSYHSKTKKWRAYITLEKHTQHLGLFSAPRDAHQAYAKAAKELHKDYACV